jgi:hypothetical protein
MPIRFYMTAVLTSVLLAVSACSSLQSARHEYVMRGQVVDIVGNEAVVCVGSRDGAQVDQELSVYRLVARGIGGPGRVTPSFEKIKVGNVRITQVVDEHFAKVRVISGEVEVNNVVELNP